VSDAFYKVSGWASPWPYGIIASHFTDEETEEGNKEQSIFSFPEYAYKPLCSLAKTLNQADLWFLIYLLTEDKVSHLMWDQHVKYSAWHTVSAYKGLSSTALKAYIISALQWII
jgi:hypothetical protein